MNLLDLITSPWAIVPERLFEIQALYAARMRGEAVDLAAVEARLGRPLANEQPGYAVHPGGVAVLPIEGVIAPKANLFTQVSGGTSAQLAQQHLQAAVADSQVKSIVLAIDSPGGNVLGGPELAAAVRAAGAVKSVVAVSDGLLCSMAYWIGSAANAVFATGPTVHVGSIGVLARHEFHPKTDGSVTTEITAGRYKRIASSNAPLTAEGRAHLQEQVDYLYSVFVDAVASNRGVSAATVLSRMAEGRIFIGSQARDAGLIDGMTSMSELVAQLAADPQRYLSRPGVKRTGLPTRASAASQALGSKPARDPEAVAAGKRVAALFHAVATGSHLPPPTAAIAPTSPMAEAGRDAVRAKAKLAVARFYGEAPTRAATK